MEPATDKQIAFMKNLKIPVREGITKAEARIAIESALNPEDEEKVEVVKIPGGTVVGPIVKTNGDEGKASNTAIMCAKDIFCALYEKDSDMGGTYMDIAIKLVKQAKEAFE